MRPVWRTVHVVEERSSQLDALQRLVEALDAVGVDYMLTGSMAMTFMGEVRFTRDVDVVVAPRPGDLRNLVKVLAEDFGADPETLREGLQAGEMVQVLAPESMAKLDLMPVHAALNSVEVFERRRHVSWRELDLKLIAPEDLIVAKLEWARSSRSAAQLRDIHTLLARGDIDSDYVRRRAAKMGLSDVLLEASDARYE
jgi:hypothetical protein